MEEKNEKNLGSLEVLPSEIMYKIFASILIDKINGWNDIFNFDTDSLKVELDRISLISKSFNVFRKKELKNFIKRLKAKRFAYLEVIIKDRYKTLSKVQLNMTLTDLLNNYRGKEDLEEACRLIIAGADFNTQVSRVEGLL